MNEKATPATTIIVYIISNCTAKINDIAIKISEVNFFTPDILLYPFLYRNTAFEHDHDFPFFHHADILDQ